MTEALSLRLDERRRRWPWTVVTGLVLAVLVISRAVTHLPGLVVSAILLACLIYQLLWLTLPLRQSRHLVIVALLSIVFSSVLAVRSEILGLAMFRVASDSMLPTLPAGSLVLVDVWQKPRRLEETRCAIVVYQRDDGTIHLKRIVGLPGENLVVDNNRLRIQGQPPRCLSSEPETFLIGTSETTIPPQHFYLLGDNRRRSHDSRHYGAIHQEKILGIVSDSYR